MAELVGISERHEYQYNATKNRKLNIQISRENSKFAILFKQTSYVRIYERMYERTNVYV